MVAESSGNNQRYMDQQSSLRNTSSSSVRKKNTKKDLLDIDDNMPVPELPHDPKLIIESLKIQIRQLKVATKGMPRCLICLDAYQTPVTSIVCWHVHCEKCWLQSLGVKKLCPQCQKITTASDLRRIYL
ncbi:10081_t:CDS:2 [Ambispora gerdemannii]|uniref:10081_t:CDS:1 n=1 Tax=Ambispora gerdemannii TaxID=144530 RepID=A0A9N8Z7H5_9GLOM|nr:10081_t:CDS:2 [Ambispora gerdemannii]